MENPCHNCPKRYPGCHASCNDYKSWKVNWDEMRERERKRKSGYRTPRRRFDPSFYKKIRGDQ